MSRELIEEKNKFVTTREDKYTSITMTEVEFEEVDARTVLFRRISKGTIQITYPTLEEARTLFQVCWDMVEFMTKWVKYGTVEVLYQKSNYAQEFAEEILETEK